MAVGILKGKIEARTYLRSFLNCDEEAVFSLEDPLPGMVEIVLIPLPGCEAWILASLNRSGFQGVIFIAHAAFLYRTCCA